MKNTEPTKAQLKDIFSYNEGVLYWEKKVSSRTKIGSAAGTLNRYLKILLFGRVYMAHRLIWIFHFGEIPHGKEIDHKNEIKTDNRIENLRLSTRSQNKLNQSKKSGVNYNKVTNRYAAFITYNYERNYIGTFTTRSEAEEAYRICKDVLFGEFLNS